MNTSTFVLVCIVGVTPFTLFAQEKFLPSTRSVEGQQDPRGLTVSEESKKIVSTYTERMLAARRTRIENAQRSLEEKIRADKAIPDAPVPSGDAQTENASYIISFNQKLPAKHVAKILFLPGLKITELHTSVGESQLAFGVARNENISDVIRQLSVSFPANLANWKTEVEKRLSQSEQMESLKWTRQEHQSVIQALTEVKR